MQTKRKQKRHNKTKKGGDRDFKSKLLAFPNLAMYSGISRESIMPIGAVENDFYKTRDDIYGNTGGSTQYYAQLMGNVYLKSLLNFPNLHSFDILRFVFLCGGTLIDDDILIQPPQSQGVFYSSYYNFYLNPEQAIQNGFNLQVFIEKNIDKMELLHQKYPNFIKNPNMIEIGKFRSIYYKNTDTGNMQMGTVSVLLPYDYETKIFYTQMYEELINRFSVNAGQNMFKQPNGSQVIFELDNSAREEEARRQREEEARRRQQEDARRQREEEARRQREEEARRRQQEDARRQREEEARRRQQEDARRQREEEARRRQQEEARRRQQEEEEEAEDEEAEDEEEEEEEEEELPCPSKGLNPSRPVNREDFVKQTRLFHPDKNPGCVQDATEKFKILNNYRSYI